MFLKTLMIISFGICVAATGAAAANYDEQKFCSDLGALANGNKQIVAPLDYDTIADLYRDNGLESRIDSAMFSAIADADFEADLEEINGWLGDTCDGLQIVRT